jgi:acyl-CoA synthetase (AMP-forming)/AMP-acid ligase II
MLTHDNITWTVQSMLSATPKGTITKDDVMISYLPLSHIAAQMLDMHQPMKTGCQIYFAQPDALQGSLGKYISGRCGVQGPSWLTQSFFILGATLKNVRPTIFFGGKSSIPASLILT